MNIFDELKNKEIKLLRQLGLVIEDRDYCLQEITDIVVRVDNYVWENKDEPWIEPYRELEIPLNKSMYYQWLKQSAVELESRLNDTPKPGKEKYKWMEGWMGSTAYDSGIIPAKKLKIEDYKLSGKEIISVVLTLGRKYVYGKGEGHIPYPLEKRTKAFHDFLKNSLLPSEQLICSNKSFCISAPSYEIKYYLEAYKKDTNRRCFVEKEELVIEKLDRLGAGKAFQELKRHFGKNSEVIEEVFRSMQEKDYIEMYPNAADRFVYLCEIKNQIVM